MRRWQKGHIKGSTFAHVIHQYLASPKFNSLADSTKSYYRRLLAIAEVPDVLGARPVEEMRPALVQAYIDIFHDRPGQARNALTAIKAVERWAIVRDKIPYPITTGIEIEGEVGGHEPWTDEQVAFAEANARRDFARVITLAANTGQRGSDLVSMRWTDIEEDEGPPASRSRSKKPAANSGCRSRMNSKRRLPPGSAALDSSCSNPPGYHGAAAMSCPCDGWRSVDAWARAWRTASCMGCEEQPAFGCYVPAHLPDSSPR